MGRPLMRYVLDTNMCSFAIRCQFGIDRMVERIPTRQLAVSVITLAEGYAGAYRTTETDRWLQRWRVLTSAWTVLDFDTTCAHHYGRIRAQLEQRGCMIGTHDCEIAATALAWAEANPDEPVTVVTDNVEEFRRVPGLLVENWVVR